MSTFVEHEGEGDLLGLVGKNKSKRNKRERQGILPFNNPKSFGFRIAGQKNRRNRNPETLLYVTVRRKSP